MNIVIGIVLIIGLLIVIYLTDKNKREIASLFQSYIDDARRLRNEEKKLEDKEVKVNDKYRDTYLTVYYTDENGKEQCIEDTSIKNMHYYHREIDEDLPAYVDTSSIRMDNGESAKRLKDLAIIYDWIMQWDCGGHSFAGFVYHYGLCLFDVRTIHKCRFADSQDRVVCQMKIPTKETAQLLADKYGWRIKDE